MRIFRRKINGIHQLLFIQTRLKYAGVKDKAPVIDVSRAGFCKVILTSSISFTPCIATFTFILLTSEKNQIYVQVLGKGVLPKQPVIVKAR